MNDEKMTLMRAEFDAADAFAQALRRHNMTTVVDDDYPQVRHEYEWALAQFLAAMKANGRFAAGGRHGLVEPQRFGSAAEFIKFLDGLHDTTADGAVTNRKWDVAQRAIAGINGLPVTHAMVEMVRDRMLAAAIGPDWRARISASVLAFWTEEIRAILIEALK